MKDEEWTETQKTECYECSFFFGDEECIKCWIGKKHKNELERVAKVSRP